MCARARVLFSAHAHPGSLKVGNTLSIPGPPSGSALPGTDGERESSVPAGHSAKTVSASSKVGAEAGPGAGKLGSGGWTPSSRHWAAGTPAPLGAPGLPGGAQETGEEEAGRGAGLSQAASCPGI